MMNQTLGKALQIAGDSRMKSLPLISRTLRTSSLTPFKANTKASALLEKLKQNEPDLLERPLSELLNLTPTNKSSGFKGTNCIMLLMMILMAMGFACTNIYISLKTGQLLKWVDMLIPLIGPVFIVWYDRGLLRKENKDVLLALLGHRPSVGMMDSISNRLSNPMPPRPSKKHYDDFDY